MINVNNNYSKIFITLFCITSYLILDTYSLCCPTYSKNEIIEKGDQRAIDNTEKYFHIGILGIDSWIPIYCANGKKSDNKTCSTGPCNIFGCNCDGRCIGNLDTDF